MKFSVIVLAIAEVASAHYSWNTNIIKGVTTPPNKYIRGTTRKTAYNPVKFSSNPAADIRDGSFVDGPDIRCNQGAFTNAGKTEIMTVSAGEEIRFKLAYGATMGHPGPGCLYASRAPNDDVKSYDGSGEWFKFFEEGICNKGGDLTNKAWCTWDRDWIAGIIPKETPSGEYLIRVEHIGVHRSHVNQPEHYPACAQVKVINGGTGTPGPLVKFPGAYKDTDPYAKFSIYNGYKEFPMPGPAVWNGTAGSVPVPAAEPVKSSSSSRRPVPTTFVAVPSRSTSKPATIPTAAPVPVKPSMTSTAAGQATPGPVDDDDDDESCSDY
ncbi:glycosyl hydrolase family 61-domain-containing protein [Rhexocercosporidium sp. MPI-PUGE-AT-0058]|nr:glycosyl hydrolase family 61-domain-containing protein [Rhexocercosporidium sp. MPI-PUGE-AT-0058]